MATGRGGHHIRTVHQVFGLAGLLLVADLHVRVVNATTGELVRELHIDPNRDYQPQK